ncbi:MAG: hypothetical protein GC145_15560 [Caulobacter sp.]|nr:hypothetical protein [Caulobacter sp.]
MPELQSRLGRRAVEAISLAATAGVEDDTALLDLIDPRATFSLGSGDVGRPLGTGPGAARAMAREMKADSFRFLGWNSIPAPADDPCGRQEVKVDFFDSGRNTVFPVTFVFKAGRIVEAKGWSLSFEAGPVARAPDVD